MNVKKTFKKELKKYADIVISNEELNSPHYLKSTFYEMCLRIINQLQKMNTEED